MKAWANQVAAWGYTVCNPFFLAFCYVNINLSYSSVLILTINLQSSKQVM